MKKEIDSKRRSSGCYSLTALLNDGQAAVIHSQRYSQRQGYSQIVTARIRRMTGGYVFTGVCLFNLGGVPTFQLMGVGGYLPSG